EGEAIFTNTFTELNLSPAQRDPVSIGDVDVELLYQSRRDNPLRQVFTDLTDSVPLRWQLGDQAGTSLLQDHRQLVRQTLAHFADAEDKNAEFDIMLHHKITRPHALRRGPCRNVHRD